MGNKGRQLTVLETNVVGVLHLTLALLPLLLKQPHATVLATTSRWAEQTGLYDALFAKRNVGTG